MDPLTYSIPYLFFVDLSSRIFVGKHLPECLYVGNGPVNWVLTLFKVSRLLFFPIVNRTNNEPFVNENL